MNSIWSIDRGAMRALNVWNVVSVGDMLLYGAARTPSRTDEGAITLGYGATERYMTGPLFDVVAGVEGNVGGVVSAVPPVKK